MNLEKVVNVPNKRKKETIEVKAFIPESLFLKLDCLFQNRKEFNVATKALASLYYKYILLNLDFTDYLLFTKKYKLKLVNNRSGNYFLYGILYANNILQHYKYPDGRNFNKYTGIAGRSRINPKLLSGKLVPFNYYIDKKSISLEDKDLSQFDDLVKINIAKIKPCYNNENEMLQHIRNQDNSIKQEISSKIYTTLNGSHKYKASYKSRPISVPDIPQFIEDRYHKVENRHLILLYMALNCQLQPQRNKTNHRLDYLLTTFPSRYLNLLTLDGEPISEIDLANSQLTILFNYLDQCYLGKGNLLYLDSGSIYKYIFEDTEANTYYCSHFWQVYRQKDVLLFKEFAFNGILYDKLKECAKMAGQDLSRDEVKKQVFALIFGKYYSYTNKQNKLLSAHFPNVQKIVKMLKVRFEELIENNTIEPIRSLKKHLKVNNDKLSHDFGNNYLSIILQRLESEIFINHLLPCLYSKNICCLPKHDSILVPESQLESTKEIIGYELSRFFDNNFFLNTK